LRKSTGGHSSRAAAHRTETLAVPEGDVGQGAGDCPPVRKADGEHVRVEVGDQRSQPLRLGSVALGEGGGNRHLAPWYAEEGAMRVTPLMVFYGACAAAGAVVPWYYNLAFMRESGELLTSQRWLAEGFTTTLMGSRPGGSGCGTCGSMYSGHSLSRSRSPARCSY
jgi:hypothetical protein